MNTVKTKISAFIDFDFTLYKKYLYQGLFAHHRQHRFKQHFLVLFIAYHFPIYQLMKIGLVSKEFMYSQHAANLAWLVKGVSVDRADLIWQWVLDHEVAPYFRPEILSAIKDHKNKGHMIIITSGSFTPILNKIVDYLNVDGAIATPLAVKNGKYTGGIIPPLNIGQGKVERLYQFLEGPGKEIDLAKSYFYTDSKTDEQVMRLFGNPVAVYPDQELAEIAKTEGWKIIGDEHAFG